MSSKCFAPRCTSGYASNKNKISLFGVNKNKLDAWRAVIPRADRVLSLKDKLCELHFEKGDIIREVKTDVYSYELKQPRLKETAIPCIWPNCPKYLSKINKKRPAVIRQDDVPIKCERISNEIPKTVIRQDNVPIKCERIPNEIPKSTKTHVVVDDVLESEVMKPSTSQESCLQDVFTSLWQNQSLVTLASDFWSMILIPNNNGHDLIAFFETIAIKNNAVVLKKVVITRLSIHMYIFQNEYTDIRVKINSIADVTKLLIDFNNVAVCYGLNLENPGSFSSSLYTKDAFSKSWRHINCKYVLKTSEGVGRSNCCVLCQNVRRAMRFCLRKPVKSTMHRELVLKKEVYNTHRRELRLKNIFRQIKQQLTTAIKTMTEIDEEHLIEKIEDMDDLH